MIQGFNPSSGKVRQCHLDEFQHSTFLVRNNIAVPVKKGSRWYGWVTAEETIFKNASITYFNYIVDNIILDDEGNACGIIVIPIIGSNFDNDYIHVWHDLPKW